MIIKLACHSASGVVNSEMCITCNKHSVVNTYM